jgi:cell division protein FtsA
MARRIITGIDIGSYQVKVVVAEHVKGKSKRGPKIIGTGRAESKGLRHGYIINSSDIINSIQSAVRQAEKASGTKIRRAFVGMGGVGLDEIFSKGETVVSRADTEVTDLDVDRAISKAEENATQQLTNRKTLHVIPLAYYLDNEQLPAGTQPTGLKATKLSVETLFIVSFEQHLNDLIQSVEEAGVEVEDVMASPLAASLVLLTKTQKMAGCVLANIGAETISIVVYEDNIPISTKVFPIGSTDITNDIALGLQISLQEAEQIKVGAVAPAAGSEAKLEEIVTARLTDMFSLIEAHLQEIGKSGLLPAGVIITGGGSGIGTIEDISKAAVKLPSRIGHFANGSKSERRTPVKDSSWAVAYGLCIWGFTADEEDSVGIKMAQKTGNAFLRWLKQFLP